MWYNLTINGSSWPEWYFFFLDLQAHPALVQLSCTVFPHNLPSNRKKFEVTDGLTRILNCSLCWRRSRRFTDPLFPLFRLIHLGRVVGADEWTLMKREWSPAVSITTQTAALIVSGQGAEPVARILAGSGPEVPLLYWTTRLTLR